MLHRPNSNHLEAQSHWPRHPSLARLHTILWPVLSTQGLDHWSVLTGSAWCHTVQTSITWSLSHIVPYGTVWHRCLPNSGFYSILNILTAGQRRPVICAARWSNFELVRAIVIEYPVSKFGMAVINSIGWNVLTRICGLTDSLTDWLTDSPTLSGYLPSPRTGNFLMPWLIYGV